MSVLDKREKLKQIKAFHQPLLDAIGVPNATLLSKVAFIPSGLSEMHIGFFESEISKKEDIYIEFGEPDLEPKLVANYPLRSLLKWRFNPNFREEYPTSDPDPKSGHCRYFVPIAELVIVIKPETKNLRTTTTNPEVKKDEKKENTVSDEDPFTREMTIRDYAAIHMRKPCSKKEWLNELVTKWNS